MLALYLWKPPAIFWITYLGAIVVGCSWLPADLASVWSKRVTKVDAFASILWGFVVSGVLKIIFEVCKISVPIYFDTFFIGLAASVLVLIIGSLFTKVTDEEKKQSELLFIVSEKDKDPKEIKKT